MARIPLDPPRTVVYRLTGWYPRRRFGTVADPVAAMAHQPRVLLTTARHEMSLDRWHRLDPTLKDLAEMAAAVAIGAPGASTSAIGSAPAGAPTRTSCARSRGGARATATPTWSGRSWPTPSRRAGRPSR